MSRSRSRRLALATLTGCLATAGTPSLALANPAWPPAFFPIAGWCGPPERFVTVAQYRLLARAGFNVVLPSCDGAADVSCNRRVLETARAAGLEAIIQDPRMPPAITGHPGARRAIDAIVRDYRRYPALLGYFLQDEPGAGRFAALAEVVEYLRRVDPAHLAFINLFPNVASTNLQANPSQLETDTYDQYLRRYMRTVRPDVLSWDHYHFFKGRDATGFFANLAAGQRAAAAIYPPTPFWQIVLAVQHDGYRALTENELRFEAMQTLAYGAHGLCYFTYWLPAAPAGYWRHGIMNADGTPGPLYDAVKAVNAEVKTLAEWLFRARVLETFQTGDIPVDGEQAPGDAPVHVAGPGNLTVSTFRDDHGAFYVLLTNRDYTRPANTTVKLDAGRRPVQQLDIEDGKWLAVRGPRDSDGLMTVPVTLSPAGAALIRWP